jgi:hypothetical protein
VSDVSKLYDSGEECSGTARMPTQPFTYRHGYVARGRCPHCGRDVATTTGGFVRSHRPKETRTTLWRTPSGRLHGMRSCSGGATPRNTTRSLLTDEQLAAFPELCRCAWGRRDKARARLAVLEAEKTASTLPARGRSE